MYVRHRLAISFMSLWGVRRCGGLPLKGSPVAPHNSRFCEGMEQFSPINKSRIICNEHFPLGGHANLNSINYRAVSCVESEKLQTEQPKHPLPQLRAGVET